MHNYFEFQISNLCSYLCTLAFKFAVVLGIVISEAITISS